MITRTYMSQYTATTSQAPGALQQGAAAQPSSGAQVQTGASSCTVLAQTAKLYNIRIINRYTTMLCIITKICSITDQT